MKGAHPEKNMTFHLNHICLTVGKSKIFSSDQFDMQVLKKLYKKKNNNKTDRSYFGMLDYFLDLKKNYI
jgi:hypothetical protein